MAGNSMKLLYLTQTDRHGDCDFGCFVSFRLQTVDIFLQILILFFYYCNASTISPLSQFILVTFN